MTASALTYHQFCKSIYFSQISFQTHLNNMRHAPDVKRPTEDDERRAQARADEVTQQQAH